MTNPSWGIKRNCQSCNAHFYDLNKTPAVCPKCKYQFDPAVMIRARRKPLKRTAPEDKKTEISSALPTDKKLLASKKKEKKQGAEAEMEGVADGIGDVAEIEDVDDIENLQELSELEEMEETPVNEDDADDESIIEELGTTGEKAIVGNVEEEEAKVLVGEIEDEEQESSRKKKPKPKKKS